MTTLAFRAILLASVAASGILPSNALTYAGNGLTYGGNYLTYGS